VEDSPVKLIARRAVLTAAGAAALSFANAARPSYAEAGLLAKLRTDKKVRVGIANEPPYSVLNPDGTMTGISPTIVKIIMTRLGVPNIEGYVAGYGQLIPGMQAGRWDFVGACLSITKLRCEQVMYAAPLVFDADAIVSLKSGPSESPKSIADLAKLGVTVGVLPGGAEFRELLANGVKLANIRQFPNDMSIVDGLLAKRVPFALMGSAPLPLLIKQRSLELKIASPVPDDPPRGAGCAFRKENTDLYDAFQKELEAMRASGEYQKIAHQYGFETPPEYMKLTVQELCSR
jgi:polar amino acid transport system substrate-binding protein